MTIIDSFRCDLCGTVYATEEECQKCEAFHVLPEGIQQVAFRSYIGQRIGVPDFMIVAMKDGSLQEYKFNKTIHMNQGEEPAPADEEEEEEDPEDVIQ